MKKRRSFSWISAKKEMEGGVWHVVKCELTRICKNLNEEERIIFVKKCDDRKIWIEIRNCRKKSIRLWKKPQMKEMIWNPLVN